LLPAKTYSNFLLAVLISIAIALLALGFLLLFGKVDSFVVINSNYNDFSDAFFQYLTILGDGMIFIPLVLYCIVRNRKFLLPAIVAIIISTILVHFLKRIVLPDELRPVSLEVHQIFVHKVDGVSIHRLHSFPSGHTATAFTAALLIAGMFKSKRWAFILPLIAALIGYSRVYLAQHFVSDVFAGIVIGTISAWSAILTYGIALKKKTVAPKNVISAKENEGYGLLIPGTELTEAKPT
jgi:membrane-associated phospholipid phosphatase